MAARQDIDAAVGRMASTGAKRELEVLGGYLWGDEQVLELARLNSGPNGGGLLAATNERVLMLHASHDDVSELSIPLTELRWVGREGGRMMPKIVLLSNEKHEMVGFSGKDCDRTVERLQVTLAARGIDVTTVPADQLRPDIDGAASRMSQKLGGKRELRKLPQMLQAGETVKEITTGTYGRESSNTGLLVLTDQRLLFFFDGWVNSKSEDFPLEVVTTVAASSGFGVSTVTISSGGHKVEIRSCPDGKRVAESARLELAAVRHRSAAPAAPTAPAIDVSDQIRKLAELRDAGILTDEEFTAKKTDLLARL